MKHFFILIILIIPLFGQSQVFFNKNKTFAPETDAVLIPSIQFSYGIRKMDFVKSNTGLTPVENSLLPEVYVGAFLLSDGFLIGGHYGVLQQSVMLSGGILIRISTGKKKKKFHH